ncbi:MAG TPA: hypothetical protein VK506_14070 [Conexibacter sp.]|nr:hypothetical protein [Conexibacter sp.]
MTRKGDDPDRIEQPDVEIGASVKAKRLRFRSRPETDVELHGEVTERGRRGRLETASGSERENLPEEVEPGITYEDVRVRWRAAARLEEPGAADRDPDRD